jgi:hypothetical protein
MAKPKGTRGSWFALWEGEQIPCVHEHWTKGIWPHHVDAGVSSDAKWEPFIKAIREGQKVILTDDKLDENGLPNGARNSYKGLFRVEKVEVRNNELHFDIVERLANFK